MVEMWRPVPQLEGRYEVSSIGRVRNVRTGAVRKILLDDKGYPYVSIEVQGKKRSLRVHQLVARAFIPGVGDCVLHYDDVKTNNATGNLRWGSRAENGADAVRNKRHHMVVRDSCKRGHKLVGRNARVAPSRGAARDCLACIKARRAIYRSDVNLSMDKLADCFFKAIMDGYSTRGAGRIRKMVDKYG